MQVINNKLKLKQLVFNGLAISFVFRERVLICSPGSLELTILLQPPKCWVLAFSGLGFKHYDIYD
jgi:hypothetical protein